jgi:hypothetical protein
VPNQAKGNQRNQVVARFATALSCAAVLWSIVDRSPGHQPLPGTRTAIELIAGSSQRGLPKVAPLRVLS